MLHGVVGQRQHGLGDALLVEVHGAAALLGEHPVPVAEARTLAARADVRSARSVGRTCTKSGRRLLASRIRSPTSRLIRSTSSSNKVRVRSTSSGSPASSIVRAKAKIKAAGIPFRVPPPICSRTAWPRCSRSCI